MTDRQTDRRQTDERQQIANVNVSSRSLKIDAPAACAVPFRPYCRGVVMRTRNVSQYMLILALCLVYAYSRHGATRNSSGNEIANVNFFTSKYNPLLNIQHDAGRGVASGRGLVVLLRRFSHAPICCNEVRF